MAQHKHDTDLQKVLLICIARPDPILSLLEWLCDQILAAEVSGLTGVEKKTIAYPARTTARLSPTAVWHEDEYDVPHAPKTAGPRAHPIFFVTGTHPQRGGTDLSRPGCLCYTTSNRKWPVSLAVRYFIGLL